MKRFLRVLSIIFLVIACVCFVGAILSALGSTMGATVLVEAGILAEAGAGVLGLTWQAWTVIGVLALCAAYACDPAYVRQAIANTVRGFGRVANTVADTMLEVAFDSKWMWVAIALVGGYFLLKSDDGPTPPSIVYHSEPSSVSTGDVKREEVH